MEVFFNIFTQKVMRDGVWASKRDLVDQIMDYMRTYNEEATPSSWNYTGKQLTV